MNRQRDGGGQREGDVCSILLAFLQTVCNDGIFPFITFFGKGGWKGTGSEPVRGYFLTYIIALACIAIGMWILPNFRQVRTIMTCLDCLSTSDIS